MLISLHLKFLECVGKERGGREILGNVGELGGKGGLLVCRLYMYVYQNISRKAILAGARGHRGRGVGVSGRVESRTLNSQDLIKGRGE